MFGLLIIDEGPLLSMTDGRAVAHFKLVWSTLHLVQTGVLDKDVLEKSISSTVWDKLVRKGSW